MKACIFDLDGTLFDSMNVWTDIDIEFLEKRNIAIPDDYTDTVLSMSFSEAATYTIERFSLPDSTQDLLREWNDMAIYAYENTVPMKPYAKEYLLSLQKQGFSLAVATSGTPELYEPALLRHGIYDCFEVICNAREVGCGKSQPDIFLLTAKKLGLSPCDCILFEDILPAVKSAKSIGMTVYAVYDKSSETDWDKIAKLADGVIFDFQNAPTLKRTGEV